MDIFLVRHGEAATTWGSTDPDPGLSDLGHTQAEAARDLLLKTIPADVQLISSPLKRAQETAIPLATELGADVAIVDTYREVPSPVPFEERHVWLRQFMQESWGGQPEQLENWRQSILSSLKALPKSSVIFSHFMVINAAYGAVTARLETVCFRPANCSVTHLRLEGDTLSLVSKGEELETVVN